MRTQPPPLAHKRMPLDWLRLYTVDAVAEQLGVSTKTVRRWVTAGALPAHRLGRQLRISEADLAAFIARSRCP